MKKNKKQTRQKENIESQLSFDFSFEEENNVVKNDKIHNAKIVSIQYYEDINRRELLKHIIHNEKSF